MSKLKKICVIGGNRKGTKPKMARLEEKILKETKQRVNKQGFLGDKGDKTRNGQNIGHNKGDG